MDKKLAQIAAGARDVAEAHNAYDEAWAEDREAHSELLAAIVNAVRPALAALASRISIALTRTAAGTTTEPAAFRGVYLVCDTGALGAPRMLPSPGERGPYGGRCLCITMAGEFVELRYSGTWSKVKGEASSWTAVVERKEPIAVAIEWDVQAILTRLADLLVEQQLGRKGQATQELLERADRIRAIAKLARSS